MALTIGTITLPTLNKTPLFNVAYLVRLTP